MATASTQARWRAKTASEKRQLNVTVAHKVHDRLDHIAEGYDLRGKGEAVAFSSFVLETLNKAAKSDPSAESLLSLLNTSFQATRSK